MNIEYFLGKLKIILVLLTVVVVFIALCVFAFHKFANIDIQENSSNSLDVNKEQPVKNKQNTLNFDDISKINHNIINHNISVNGSVRNIYISKAGHVFFYIYDAKGNKIKAVLFKNYVDEKPQRLKIIQDKNNSNDIVKFFGKVDFYKGELEIIVQKVEIRS